MNIQIDRFIRNRDALFVWIRCGGLTISSQTVSDNNSPVQCIAVRCNSCTIDYCLRKPVPGTFYVSTRIHSCVRSCDCVYMCLYANVFYLYVYVSQSDWYFNFIIQIDFQLFFFFFFLLIWLREWDAKPKSKTKINYIKQKKNKRFFTSWFFYFCSIQCVNSIIYV